MALALAAALGAALWFGLPAPPRNLLVLGVDRDGSRSDVIILLSASPRSGQLSAVSVPRDTQVRIPGREGLDKVGHAHAYGGPQLAMRTVAGLFGAPVHGYVEFDFQAFAAAVDALGGVPLRVEKRMRYDDPYQDLHIDLRPGEQVLTGEQALQYVRYRDETGDIGRIARQHAFLRALAGRALSLRGFWRLPFALAAALPRVRTDLGWTELWSLTRSAMAAGPNGLRTASLAGRPVEQGGLWYWAPDRGDVRRIASTLLFARAAR